MQPAIVLFFYAAVLLFDYIPMCKKKGKKENIIYGSFLVITFVVLLLYSFDIDLPSPSEPIRHYGGMILKVLDL